MGFAVNIELAWAAGFIDGEGCFSIKRRKTKPTPSFRIVQVDPRPLQRLQAVIGGSLTGPTSPPSHKGKPFYILCLYNKALYPQVERLWPYMCEPKKEQWKRVLEQIEVFDRGISKAI